MQPTNSKQTVQRLLSTQRERIDHPRIGRIISLEPEQDSIWVDYDENPFHTPLKARLAVVSANFEDLKQAVIHSQSVRLEFEEGDPERPVIKEIYLSLDKLKKSAEKASTRETLHVKGYDIILEAENRIIIKAGGAQTIYSAQGATLVSEAGTIDASATFSHKLKGGAVIVN